MLYQKLLMGERPYFLKISKMHGFQEHRHSEIEINYCLKGHYDIIIGKNLYRVNEGEFVFISSMTPHEIPLSPNSECQNLTMEIGPMLLSGYFEALAGKSPENPVFNFKKKTRLNELVEETASLYQNPQEFSELMIRGNIFNICAIIMKQIVSANTNSHTSKALRCVANIENALQLIHTRYNDNLTIEEVAKICGYSQSNFCMIFKNITGETFHSMLNNQRVKVACNLLKETNLSVESVAVQAGFADSKSFCRVFKNTTGVTPGAYRNGKDT